MTIVAEDTSAPPLLSVIVPSHNVRPWISETMRTLLGQDLRDLEIIVIDDHSTDGTREILAGFESRDARVSVIDATEFGGAAARNLGLRYASGRYLAFCDADDLVPPGAYRALVDSLEASGSEIAFGDFLKFSTTATWRPTSGWPAFSQPRVGFTLSEQPSIIRGRAVWNKVFRRDFWERVDIRFPETARSNDIVPMLTSYFAAQSFDLVEDVVYLYRERPGGSSMTSRARSSASLRAYLEQELSCADLVGRTADHGVSSVFAGVFLEADGWKHLAEHLSDPRRDSGDDDEIGRLLDEIIRRLPAFRFDRLSRLRRAVFSLARRGDLTGASLLLRVTEPRPRLGAEDLGAWAAAIEHLNSANEPIAGRECARLITPLLADRFRSGSDRDDPDLVRLVRAAERASADDEWRPLGRLPELDSLGEIDDVELLARIRSGRSAAHRITSVGARRSSITVSGSGGSPTTQLALRSATDHRRIPLPSARTGPANDVGWTIDLRAAGRLPIGERMNLVATADGVTHSLVGCPETVRLDAARDRMARFTLGTTSEGGIWIERRAHWTVRGSRRVLRRIRALLPKC